jgi:hypothetical protein
LYWLDGCALTGAGIGSRLVGTRDDFGIRARGFLDGSDGFVIASSVAYQTLSKYAKLLKLQTADKN